MMLALSAPFSCSGLLRRARPAAAPSTPLAGPRRCSVLVRAEFKVCAMGPGAALPMLQAAALRRRHPLMPCFPPAAAQSDDKGREAYKTSPVLPAFTRRR